MQAYIVSRLEGDWNQPVYGAELLSMAKEWVEENAPPEWINDWRDEDENTIRATPYFITKIPFEPREFLKWKVPKTNQTA